MKSKMKTIHSGRDGRRRPRFVGAAGFARADLGRRRSGSASSPTCRACTRTSTARAASKRSRWRSPTCGGNVNGKKIELVYRRPPEQGRHRRFQGARMVRRAEASTADRRRHQFRPPTWPWPRWRRKRRSLISRSVAGSARLTNEECSPYTVHYAYDTVALAKGTGSRGGQAGRQDLVLPDRRLRVRRVAGDRYRQRGRRPTAARCWARSSTRCRPRDFSSFLLQAQASKAQILGLANAGGDTINSIKAANEFGITKTMKMAGLLMFINDIHSLGPEDRRKACT